MKKWLTAFAATCMILISLALAAPASAQTSTPAYWAHWRKHTSYQVVVYGVFKGDTRWLYNTKLAAHRWDTSSRVYMRIVSSCPTGRNCFYVYTKALGRNGVLGITYDSWYYPSTHMASSKIIINSSYATYHNTVYNVNIPCHEEGHALGMGHYADGSQGPCINAYPRSGDYYWLRLHYAHLDSTGPPGVPYYYGGTP